jgi:hypothetical protein
MPRVALTDRFVASAKQELVRPLRVTQGREASPCEARDLSRHKPCRRPYEGAGSPWARRGRGGKDPRDLIAAQDGSAMTVANLIASYLDKHAKPRLKSVGHMEQGITANLMRAIGSARLADLHRRDINRVLDPIIARNSLTQARLVYTDLR